MVRAQDSCATSACCSMPDISGRPRSPTGLVPDMRQGSADMGALALAEIKEDGNFNRVMHGINRGAHSWCID